jgi:hypothetical protein
VTQPLLTILIGLAAGYVSGQFGIGGALLATPAIRLLLDVPAIVAVGTTLPVVVPTALVGAIAYGRQGLLDPRAGALVGLGGAVASVPAALLSARVGGPAVLLLTALLILVLAADTMRAAVWAEVGSAVGESGSGALPRDHVTLPLVGVGIAAGALSGLLGVGGGFVIVPALARLLGYPIKTAIGTSLMAIAILAVPGSVTHISLGHVDIGIALALAAGVVPGALLGARVTALAQDRTVRIAFACLLVVAAVVLGLNELGVLL